MAVAKGVLRGPSPVSGVVLLGPGAIPQACRVKSVLLQRCLGETGGRTKRGGEGEGEEDDGGGVQGQWRWCAKRSP